jgi:hypothetical protein
MSRSAEDGRSRPANSREAGRQVATANLADDTEFTSVLAYRFHPITPRQSRVVGPR